MALYAASPRAAPRVVQGALSLWAMLWGAVSALRRLWALVWWLP